MKCEKQFRNHPNGQFFTREMYSPERPKFSDHKSTGSSNSHSPCNFMRDRVESPINGTVCCFIKKNNNRVAWVPGDDFFFFFLFFRFLVKNDNIDRNQ